MRFQSRARASKRLYQSHCDRAQKPGTKSARRTPEFGNFSDERALNWPSAKASTGGLSLNPGYATRVQLAARSSERKGTRLRGASERSWIAARSTLARASG